MGDNQGGGVCLYGGGEVLNCTIENNRAQFGGGVYCAPGGVVRDCLIRNNSAQGGGGVHGDGGQVLNSIVQGNTAFDVGGVACFNGALVRNCLISGNSSYAYGGIHVSSGGRVESSTVAGNNSSGVGGAMTIDVSAGAVLNTIIYSNTVSPGAVGDPDLAGDTSLVSYCSAPSISGGTGNITNAPRFVDASAGDYRLQAGSPCINVGVNDGWMTTAVDLDGHARILDGTVDMGAYEASVAPSSWAKADFAVETIQVAPTTLATGTAFGATVTVRNRGGIAGDAGLLRVWVSRASLVVPGEAGSAQVTVGGLAPGESRTLTFTGLAAPASAGTHQFRACVDADDVTPEYSWADNQMAATYTTTVAGGASDSGVNTWDRADFAVTHQAFIGPSPTVAGEKFAVRVTVVNRGQIAGDAGNLGVFASHFDPVVIGETADATVAVGVLQPGQSRTVEIDGLVAAAARGPHLLRSYADIDGLTPEWGEGDNQLTLLYQISPIFLHVQPGAGGVALSWNSFWGDRYIVYRTENLSVPFVPIATGIEATPPTNGYLDVNPPSGGAFYKIGVQPWGAEP
jgi:hypothetical protein